jgi:ornithine cyclodeaminase/alanine dehydrogenase-like protein (mu-crystallin family)
MKTLVLSIHDIHTLVNRVGLHRLMDEMIDRLVAALQEYNRETHVIPARGGFHYCEPGLGLLEWMPSMKVGVHATIKIVGYHPTNPILRNLPTILSTISAFDVTTGHLRAIADATFLTALRTGAASAVASKIMAISHSRTVGLIGCGAQALTQLHALSRMFDIEHVFVYDVDPAVSLSFLDRASFLDLEIAAVQQEALPSLIGKADILCTATTVAIGEGPVIPDVETKPWLHINAVGSDFPGKIELPRSLLERSIVCPDFLDQAINEGECQQLGREEIGPTLAELVQHEEAYRFLQEKLTVFDSTGWALEDRVAMTMLMEYAAELRLGSFLQVEACSTDPRHPYEGLLDVNQASLYPNGVAREAPPIYGMTSE